MKVACPVWEEVDGNVPQGNAPATYFTVTFLHVLIALNHELLIETLSEHIHDGRFIHLMQDLLDAGYLEEWTFHQILSGVPQGSIVTPPTMLQKRW